MVQCKNRIVINQLLLMLSAYEENPPVIVVFTKFSDRHITICK